MYRSRSDRTFLTKTGLLFVFIIAFYYRASGLFHGLQEGIVFHPDTPKQILNLHQGLQNNHITYHGNLFYDGYPYGLNRVDEGLIRLTRAGMSPLYRLTFGYGEALPLPTRLSLYYIARTLRVLYGLLTALLLAKSIQIVATDRFALLCAMLLFAVSPLSASVTHYASGDIGVDLFLALSLFCMVLHTQKPLLRHIFTAGMAVGLAFACKYQGALGAWTVALYLLLSARPFTRSGMTDFIRQGLVSTTGFIAGVLLLTPGFWVDPSRTWKLMRANVIFIKNYGVPPDFMDLPRHIRIVTGLTNNVPVVLHALGGLLVLATFMSLITALIRQHTSRCTEDQAPPHRELHLWTATATFPFFVILISTAMKPMVQPFHFSFLVAPMLFTTAMLLKTLRARPTPKGTGWAVGIAGLIFLQTFPAALREDQLWRAPSIHPLYNRYATHSTVEPLHIFRDFSSPHGIKLFYLHPYGLPVFRNLPRIITGPHRSWWQKHEQLPVPSRPLDTTVPGWIFLNGARFPNNDHLFRLSGGSSRRIRLVHSGEPPETLSLGLRSGREPVFLSGKLGTAEISLYLPPHSQKIIDLQPGPPAKNFPGEVPHDPTFIHHLDLSAHPGNLWVEILNSSLQREIFSATGPVKQKTVPRRLDPQSTEVLASVRFLHEEAPFRVTAERRPLFPVSEGLPAGSYELNLSLVNRAETAKRLSLSFSSQPTTFPEDQTLHMEVLPGFSQQTFTFHKAFSPFELDLYLRASSGELTVLEWTLRPAAIQTPLPEPDIPKEVFFPIDIHYREGIHLSGIHLSLPEVPDDPLRWGIQARIDRKLSRKLFKETAVFIHLVRNDGRLFQALDIPLRAACFSGGTLELHQTLSAGRLPEQEPLHLEIGLYRPRTLRRMHPRSAKAYEEDLSVHRQAIRLHTFEPPLQGAGLPH